MTTPEIARMAIEILTGQRTDVDDRFTPSTRDLLTLEGVAAMPSWADEVELLGLVDEILREYQAESVVAQMWQEIYNHLRRIARARAAV